MRRFAAAAILLLACSPMTTEARQTVPDWENPRVFDINKEPPHAEPGSNR